MGKQGDEEFEQLEVGGESRSLEALCFAGAELGSETREEGEERAPATPWPPQSLGPTKLAGKEARRS